MLPDRMAMVLKQFDVQLMDIKGASTSVKLLLVNSPVNVSTIVTSLVGLITI